MFKSNLEMRDTITWPLKRRQIAILVLFWSCLSKISSYFLIEKQGNRFLRYLTQCDSDGSSGLEGD